MSWTTYIRLAVNRHCRRIRRRWVVGSRFVVTVSICDIGCHLRCESIDCTRYLTIEAIRFISLGRYPFSYLLHANVDLRRQRSVDGAFCRYLHQFGVLLRSNETS